MSGPRWTDSAYSILSSSVTFPGYICAFKVLIFNVHVRLKTKPLCLVCDWVAIRAFFSISLSPICSFMLCNVDVGLGLVAPEG